MERKSLKWAILVRADQCHANAGPISPALNRKFPTLALEPGQSNARAAMYSADSPRAAIRKQIAHMNYPPPLPPGDHGDTPDGVGEISMSRGEISMSHVVGEVSMSNVCMLRCVGNAAIIVHLPRCQEDDHYPGLAAWTGHNS